MLDLFLCIYTFICQLIGHMGWDLSCGPRGRQPLHGAGNVVSVSRLNRYPIGPPTWWESDKAGATNARSKGNFVNSCDFATFVFPGLSLKSREEEAFGQACDCYRGGWVPRPVRKELDKGGPACSRRGFARSRTRRGCGWADVYFPIPSRSARKSEESFSLFFLLLFFFINLLGKLIAGPSLHAYPIHATLLRGY